MYTGQTLRKESGALKYNLIPLFAPSAYISVEAGHDWWPTPTAHRAVLVVSDGANAVLMLDRNDGAFFIASGIVLAGQVLPPMFVEGGAEVQGRPKKLFIFTQNTQSVVLIGSSDTVSELGQTQLTAPPRVRAATPDPGAGVLPGSVDNGVHQYQQTYKTADGETIGSVASDPVWIFNNTQVGIIRLDFEVCPATVTKRRVYRSQVGGGGPFRLLVELDAAVTAYMDDQPHSALDPDEPPAVNTTSGRPLEWGGTNWPHCATLHAGRLCAAGNANDPHRIYLSTTSDHENFLSAGSASLSVFPGEGQYISGMLSFSGRLIVWKYPKGIYVVDTASPDLSDWRVDRLTNAVGGLNGLTQTVVEGDVIFMDASGDIHLLSAVQAFTDLEPLSLSKAAQIDQIIRDHADSLGLLFAKMVYYARRRQVHISMRTKGSTVNNVRLVLDGNLTNRPRFHVSNRDVCQSLWVMLHKTGVGQQTVLMSGDASGTVWALDQPGTSKAGAGYDSRFQTMWTDLSFADPSLATKDKNAQFLELAFNPTGRWPVNINVWWDARVATQGTFIPADPSGYYLGTWALGAGVLADDTAVLIRRFRLAGGGRRISLEISNDQPGQDFSIAHAYLSFMPAAERAR